MMNEYCINGLTIKENLLRLAGEGNKNRVPPSGH
jgi:hypothetical protein